MSNMNIEGMVIRCISEQLGAKEDEIKPENRLVDDLGADSLDTVELVMALEEEFEMEISDEEAEELQTVHDIIEYVRKNV